MSPRVVQFEFHSESRLWHATSRVEGSMYCVRGGTVREVLTEFCRLLNHPSRRWQVHKRDAEHLVCNELPEMAADLPITAEIPAFRQRSRHKGNPACIG